MTCQSKILLVELILKKKEKEREGKRERKKERNKQKERKTGAKISQELSVCSLKTFLGIKNGATAPPIGPITGKCSD